MELRSKFLYKAPPKQSILLPLTQQNLQTCGNEIPSSIESDTETVSSDSTASSTDPMLSQRLYDAGVRFELLHALAPDDEEELLQILSQEREGPNHEEAREILQRLTQSYNEEVYKSHLVSVILNPLSRRLSSGHSIQMDLEWTAVRGNFSTIEVFQNPKPDYFETLHSTTYPSKARNALGWTLSPCNKHPITMPTFCVEFKSPEKASRNAITQAAYDGAIMVYAALERHKYLKKPAYDFFGKTQALVMAITGDVLDVFACHAIPVDWDHQSDDYEYPPKLNYHIFKVAESTIMSEAGLKTVFRLIQNAQDWCCTQAELVRKELQNFFEELEEKETKSLMEDRERYNAAWLAMEARRKRKIEQAELEQQDLPIKRRKVGL